MSITHLNDEQITCCKLMGRTLFNGKSSESIKQILSIFALEGLVKISNNRSEEDPLDHIDTAVEITHFIESSLRDFVEWEIDQEYGPSEDEKNGLD